MNEAKERFGGFEFLPHDAVHALICLVGDIRYSGHLSPKMARVQAMLTRKPVKGDLVVERSTMWWPPENEKRRNAARVGIFDRMELEPVEGADEDYREKAYYITPLDGDTPVRWVNCEFMVLPKNGDEVLRVTNCLRSSEETGERS